MVEQVIGNKRGAMKKSRRGDKECRGGRAVQDKESGETGYRVMYK